MMKKKIITTLVLLLVLLFSCSSVFATNVNTQAKTDSSKIESKKSIFELVDKSICEMDLNNLGHFKKELTSFDANKKELTITLSVTNTAKKEEITKPVEVYLVLDNSFSMTKTYQNKSKMSYVTETANLFVDSLFEHFTNPKIGVVSFSSIDNTTSTGVSLVLGSTSDAKLLLPLSDSKQTVKSAITTYAQETGPYTNIEAGLSLAQSKFTTSTETEKYVVLISDGVPNLSLDTEHTLTYSGTNATNTKNRLQNMQSQGIHIYSVLMGLNESNIPNPNAPSLEDGSRKMTYGELAEEIFGTVENPTAGDFYFINYDSLDTTINTNIYGDITYVKDNTLKNIVIKDYIPQDIINNFDFSYVAEPNFGKATPLNTEDNSITWTIPELKEGETATVSYKLKLHDSYDSAIVNKILPTNTKVDITYETPTGTGSVTSDVSPKVRLKYENNIVIDKDPEKPANNTVVDNTISDDKMLPQTGIYTTLLLIAGIGIVVFAVSRVINMQKIK